MLRDILAIAAIVLDGASCPTGAVVQDYSIDTSRSVLIVRVFKSGIFSAFAHDHEIEAPVAEGDIHLSADPSVTLRVRAGELRVLDPELSTDKRNDVQKTMDGPKVLDIQRFPEISFQSTAVQKKGKEQWIVHGNLALHGQTVPVEVEVTQKEGHYRGSVVLRQRVFGITPVAIAGGTVTVKDEVKIEFDIIMK
jgi:polyisoprenoid-binding protein YceI